MDPPIRQALSEVMVSVFARTDIGMRRDGNEDAFLVADLTTGNTGLGPGMSTHRVGNGGSLMVVSDGMGGAAAGEIASELAVNTVWESLMSSPLESDISDRLRQATEIANENIWNHARENPEFTGMGATLTAVLVQGTSAYIAQVGDSRAYLCRKDRIKQLTKDQSLVQMLVDSGAVAPEESRSIPHNVIMQALGTQPTVQAAMTMVELCRNDYLLLCSDGLSNKIEPDEMHRAILNAPSLTAACRNLVEVANARGGEDNITVIIAHFDGEALNSAADSITGSCRSISADFLPPDAAEIQSRYTASKPAAPESADFSTVVMKTPLAEATGPGPAIPLPERPSADGEPPAAATVEPAGTPEPGFYERPANAIEAVWSTPPPPAASPVARRFSRTRALIIAALIVSMLIAAYLLFGRQLRERLPGLFPVKSTGLQFSVFSSQFLVQSLKFYDDHRGERHSCSC